MYTYSDNYGRQWKSERQIREEEFRAGYGRAASVAGLRSDRRNDGGNDDIEHNHTEGTASETTMYTTRKDDKYDPNDTLPQCERFSNKGEKYARLWRLNAGRDDHTVAGKTYKDGEIGKVNQPARDRARFVHGVADACDLSRRAINNATGLARRLDPRVFNYYGGMDVFILAVVGYVATTNGYRSTWSGNLEAFHEIRQGWDISIENLSSAIEKIDDKVG